MFQFKVGQRVRFTRMRKGVGVLTEGRVAGTDIRSNGPYVSVNMAPKGANAKLISLRPVRLTKV